MNGREEGDTNDVSRRLPPFPTGHAGSWQKSSAGIGGYKADFIACLKDLTRSTFPSAYLY